MERTISVRKYGAKRQLCPTYVGGTELPLRLRLKIGWVKQGGFVALQGKLSLPCFSTVSASLRGQPGATAFLTRPKASSPQPSPPAFARRRGRGGDYALMKGSSILACVVDERNAPVGAEIWGKAAALPYLCWWDGAAAAAPPENRLNKASGFCRASGQALITVFQHGVGVIARSAGCNGVLTRPKASSPRPSPPAFARRRGRGWDYASVKGSIDSGACVVDERNAPVGAEIWGKAAALPYLCRWGRSAQHIARGKSLKNRNRRNVVTSDHWK